MLLIQTGIVQFKFQGLPADTGLVW